MIVLILATGEALLLQSWRQVQVCGKQGFVSVDVSRRATYGILRRLSQTAKNPGLSPIPPEVEERWRLATNLIRSDLEGQHLDPSHLSSNDCVVARACNRPSFDKSNRVSILTSLWFAITNCICGGLHVLAWNAAFGSPKQGSLWRTSAVYVSVFGLIPFFRLLYSSWLYYLDHKRATTDE